MSNRYHTFLVALVAMLVATGCKDRAPSPSSTSSPHAATNPQVAANPHAANAPVNPHTTGQIPLPEGHPAIAPTVKTPSPGDAIDAGAVAFRPPPTWKFEQPASSMRRAQLKAPGADGEAELVVYFFGAGGAGSAKDNIDRWVGQFSNKDGSPIQNAQPTEQTINGFKVTKVEVAGQYAGGMGPQAQQQPAKAEQRLIATIVETPGGPYYFKFVGPDASVAENREAFDQLLASIEASP